MERRKGRKLIHLEVKLFHLFLLLDLLLRQSVTKRIY